MMAVSSSNCLEDSAQDWKVVSARASPFTDTTTATPMQHVEGLREPAYKHSSKNFPLSFLPQQSQACSRYHKMSPTSPQTTWLFSQTPRVVSTGLGWS